MGACPWYFQRGRDLLVPEELATEGGRDPGVIESLASVHDTCDAGVRHGRLRPAAGPDGAVCPRLGEDRLGGAEHIRVPGRIRSSQRRVVRRAVNGYLIPCRKGGSMLGADGDAARGLVLCDCCGARVRTPVPCPWPSPSGASHKSSTAAGMTESFGWGRFPVVPG